MLHDAFVKLCAIIRILQHILPLQQPASRIIDHATRLCRACFHVSCGKLTAKTSCSALLNCKAVPGMIKT